MRYLISMFGLAVIVGVGYFAVAQYVNVAQGQSSLLTNEEPSTTTSPDGAYVLALLNTLQQIKLDGRIFSDPNFATLQDWSVTIDPQTVGRVNPYLPASGAFSPASPNTSVPLPRR